VRKASQSKPWHDFSIRIFSRGIKIAVFRDWRHRFIQVILIYSNCGSEKIQQERVTRMKAFVDKDTCIGCGLCESVCPKVFRMNHEGLAEAIEASLDDSAAEDAREAQAQCPVEAITIEK
jgi:ferredoxin